MYILIHSLFDPLYADDAKIFKVVSQITDQLDLQAIMDTVKT